MKKVLHVSKFYYPDVGGIENTARDAVTALKLLGCQNKVICFNHVRGDVTDYIDDVEIVRCDCVTKIASQSISFSIIREFKKILAEWKPDYVLLHWPNPYMAEVLLRACTDEKIIVYWHSDIIKQKVLGKLFHGMSIRLLDKSFKIIATSPNYIEGSPYLSRFKEKCVVIPSCVNEKRLEVTDDIKKKAQEIRNENEGKIICLSVGRHVEYKGFEYLIKASHLLNDNYRFFITGDGPLTAKLKNEASGDDKIHFLGRIDNDNLKAFFEAADIFCFPSITKNEAYGLALAEGMYFGLPAITFSIEGSGVNYVNLDGVTGVEIENRNVEKFAQAIVKLGEDSVLRAKYGNNAKQRVNELMSYDHYKSLFSEII